MSTEGSIVQYANSLADSIDKYFTEWLERCVFDTARVQGAPVSDALRASTTNMATTLHERYVPALRELLSSDIDQQATTPMAILRQATVGPTQVLAQYEVPVVERDDYLKSQFPDDHYGLMPSTFADIHPDVAEPGLAWGAAKAFAHKKRHQR